MTYREFTEKLLKEYGIDYEIEEYEFDKAFPQADRFKGYKGTRHGIEWHLIGTCSWDNYCQLIYGDYRANRISIKTAIKKILAL